MEFIPWKIFRKRRHVSRNERAEKYSNHLRMKGEIYQGVAPRLLLVLIFVLCGLLLLPPAHRTKEIVFKTGDVADREIIAPFDFQVPQLPEQLSFERAKAAVNVLPVYVQDRTVEKNFTRELATLLDSLQSIASNESLTTEKKIVATNTVFPYLSKNSSQALVNPSSLKGIAKAAKEFQSQLFTRGVINNSGPLRRSDYTEISVLDGNVEKRLKVKDIIEQGRLDQLIREEAVSRFGRNRDRAQAFIELVRAHVLPTLLLDSEETQRRREEAMERVKPYFEVSKNQRIIGAHDKVTREQENILKALERTRASLETSQSPLMHIGLYTSEALRLAIFGILFGGYLFIFHRKIYQDLVKVIAVFCIMVLFLVFMAVVVRFSLSHFLIPVAFVSLMLTALFDYRLGLVGTVFVCFLVTLVGEVPASVGFVSLLAGTTAVVWLQKLRSRTHLYSVFLYISVAYIVGIISVELGQANNIAFFYKQSLWGIANSFFASVSVMFLLPVFETVFDLTTRFTLLELTDLNKPILKRLNMEANGTYHHSMLIGDLVSAVAEEIGADPLRARVMAYYHDVGKVFKPEYYAENQSSDFNKHEKITPQMSGLVLVSHVKDGVELAREEKLPSIVIDAIREHHGKTVMAYFYQKALETDSHSSVNKDDFRYPGPRPRSKESALLMLADTVEAAVRSLKAPTPAHIRNMVVKLVDSRMHEGELDDSGLTLKDLSKIKEKFISILTGIYHKRIAYPGQDEEEEEEEKGEVVAKPVRS
ncbi:MAG: HDIG domain-containing protein [Candidatus Latescibacteria bacterium]|nr:HDIG domain-containing protein [Candidatus Latescibacterota bacterium]NIM21606.1 HDIG domain-containing protein [Candidatus Latescibacterota bacterium]NIM64585.1 HDIG domain-containing protein [Candidatus Latescibacterota bacterium]NIO01100.1 HDIG domain-containing protein [Candidatus Latescibacterota bacterium]NIO27493.1 HDIG domain-containing protein [Candidatus Latescibacterota bacterium]